MIDLKPLLDPIDVHGLRLKNRLVMAPMHTDYANRDGTITDRLVAYLAERARGGASLVIVEFANVDAKGSTKADRGQVAAESDDRIPGLARLASAIKAGGARAALQINHSGAQHMAGGYPTVAASPVPWSPVHSVPRELTIAEIQDIVEAFGAAARRVKQAGFDLVEIHGAHGYLITNFLSGYSNRRQDAYGGPLENRMRFALEVVAAVRRAVGPDYPIGFRLNGEDWTDLGNRVEDQVEVAKALERAGVDLIHVSGGGIMRGADRQISPMYLPRGVYRHAAAAIKRAVSIPVMVCGSMSDPADAAEAIARGEADLVANARQFLADPHWPAKIAAGRPEEITGCLRCNECLEWVDISQPTMCAVNPFGGREADPDWQLRPVDTPRRVLVVGGGPAGLQAATIAARRGHRVRLVEQASNLGGQLIAAGRPDFKVEVRRYLAHLAATAERAGVTIELGRRIEGDSVEGLEADVVVVATGSTAEPAPFAASAGPKAIDVEAALRQDGIDGRVVIFGWMVTALEVAWWLADGGASVTVASPVVVTERDYQTNRQRWLNRRLEERGVARLAGVQFGAVGEEGVFVEDASGRTQALPADWFIFEPNRRPSDELGESLGAAGVPHVVVGDAYHPAGLLRAVHGATAAALRL